MNKSNKLYFLIFLIISLGYLLLKPLLQQSSPLPSPPPSLSSVGDHSSYPAHQKIEYVLNLSTHSLTPSALSRLLFPSVQAAQPLIQAHLNNPDGRIDSRFPVTITPQDADSYQLTVDPIIDFRPGRYQLVVEINQDNQLQTLQSDFYWGVLAINFNQAEYQLKQSVQLQLASLDNYGRTLCLSHLQIDILDPQGKTTSLTNDQGLTLNPNCGQDNVIDEPDYSAKYQPQTIGTYQVTVTNLDTNLSITDSFSVFKTLPLTIERQGATRINPFASEYTMNLTVTSQNSQTIDIVETIPPDFIIVPAADYEIITASDQQQIIWRQTTLKKNQPHKFSYRYQAPKISPAIFFLGPMRLDNYTEPRRWQLASDAPYLVVDSTSSTATAYASQRRIIRTTYGTNNNRVFVLAYNGTALFLYYSDDVEASAPTWNSVSIATGAPSASMVWDESNDVIYVVYGLAGPIDSDSSDVNYKLITSPGTTPAAGAARKALDGNAGGTTYHLPHVEIAQDSSTTKVFAFGNVATAANNPQGWSVAVGTINSDDPTWGTFAARSWTATANTGLLGVARSNTNKLVVQYAAHNGSDVDVFATRHDDASDAEATSGWDELDGTDNSQTVVSDDVPPARGAGSIVGMPATDAVWFAWQDASNELNTKRWNGSSLDSEMIPVNFAVSTYGPSLTSDGVTLWLAYRDSADSSLLVYQSRSATDGSTAWSGTTVTLDDTSESVTYPQIAKKAYQGKLDIIYTTSTNFYVRHASSYKIAGNVYQESAGSPYEGTTVWSGCDGATLNVAVSVNGGTKQNTWCSASDGSYYFVLGQPSGSDQDITVFLDTGGGNKGALFTHNNDAITDITGLTLYKDKVIIRSESSSSITNADINTYDQTNDSDIPIASDGTNITVDSGYELHINSGETFAPGGNVTTPKLHIKGTYTGASETLTLNGSGSSSSCDNTVANLRPLCIDSGTFTVSSNTTLFSGSTASLIQNATYNTLRIEPGGNSITHTFMAGTTTVGGNLTLGNGTNTGVIVTAATNATTLTANANLTISANTTFVANASNTTSVAGNWANSGSFTHSSGTVAFTGADSSTQAITGNTTFNNFSVSTSGNSAGRTVQFAGSSTTTVAGTWTVTGFSGKVVTLQSSNTNAWTINPTAASVTYVSVSRSTNTGTSFCATYSTDGLNNTGWNISTGPSCNTAPSTPSLDSPSDTATGQSLTPALLTTTTDTDSDYLRYKIQLCENVGMTTNCQTFDQTSSQTGWSGQNTQSNTAYTSGTQATYTVQSSLANSFTYFWRSYAIDPGGSNTWSSTQGTPYSFTTLSGGPANDSFQFQGLNLEGVKIN